MPKYQGGCHCKKVRFEVTLLNEPELSDCNCSICSMTGFLHLILPIEQFKLLNGKEFLTSYQFNTKTAQHLFCQNCGIKSFYIPRSHPDGVSINARCLDENVVGSLEVNHVNGKNWESHYPEGRGDFS